MIYDIDVYRAANVLIREHGEYATIEAYQRAGQMLDRRDIDGLAVWEHILAAVEEIRRTEPTEGEATH